MVKSLLECSFRQQSDDVRVSWWLYAEGQYESLHHLLGEFAAYTARAPYLALRPHCRPRSPKHARDWWRYATAVVRQQLEPSFSWDSVSQVLSRCPVLLAYCYWHSCCCLSTVA